MCEIRNRSSTAYFSHWCTTTSSPTTSATRASPWSSSSTAWWTAARASASGSTENRSSRPSHNAVIVFSSASGDSAMRLRLEGRPLAQQLDLLVGEGQRDAHVVGAGGAVEVAGRDHEPGGGEVLGDGPTVAT